MTKGSFDQALPALLHATCSYRIMNSQTTGGVRYIYPTHVSYASGFYRLAVEGGIQSLRNMTQVNINEPPIRKSIEDQFFHVVNSTENHSGNLKSLLLVFEVRSPTSPYVGNRITVQSETYRPERNYGHTGIFQKLLPVEALPYFHLQENCS
ncbi:MAG: hypothetical protein VXW65_11645 [Pseudomonadota bacterium]|nr:hypothetical protein [Pseudomonadota bacterium]